MKITIINGSPRKNGSTSKILKRLQANLENKDRVVVSYYNLIEYSLLDCSGCLSCYAKGTCHMKDDLENINKEVAESDALIIGSPVVLEQSLHGKYTFAIATYEIGGSGDVINILNKLFRISGGISLGNAQIKLPFNSNPFDLPILENQLNKVANKIYKAISKRQTKSWFDSLFNRVAIHNVIKPYVMNKPKQYKAVIERWRELKIVNEN